MLNRTITQIHDKRYRSVFQTTRLSSCSVHVAPGSYLCRPSYDSCGAKESERFSLPTRVTDTCEAEGSPETFFRSTSISLSIFDLWSFGNSAPDWTAVVGILKSRGDTEHEKASALAPCYLITIIGRYRTTFLMLLTQKSQLCSSSTPSIK